ncbi:MAG: alpha-L-fucosidase [Lentisphaeria bacterium]|nr:alpha-L-fucosidase [Lentisphaeria bacterium]
MKPIIWSFGMQSRPMFHVGKNPDIEGAVKAAAKAGMKDAVIFGKDHTGLCFHPTKWGIQHPNTKIDLTGEMTKALHKYNMRALAYFNLGMDGEMGRRHPDWLQEKAPGKTLVTADHFADICVFHDYRDQYMYPVIMEMFEKYDIDGIFLDTMSAFQYCCCPKCREAFEKEMHRPLPLPDEKDNPDWKLYGPWQYQRTVDFMAEVRETILSKYPDAEILFNHIGGPGYPYALPGIETGIVSCDPPAFFPWISIYSSYLSSLEHGGDIFIERFARGWGDRCDLEDRTLKYKCAAIFAHRQRYCVGDRMHPDARLADGSAHAMDVINGVWKEFNRALPDRLNRKDDFLFLMPESYRCGTAKQKYASPNLNSEYYGPMLGTFRMLLDGGYSFQTVPEFALERNLAAGKTVIITGAESLTEKTNCLLKEFVRKGGKILFAGNIPVLEDGTLPDYCGISSAKKSLHTCIYLPGKVKYGRTLVRGTLWELELSGAKPLMYGFPQDYAEEVKDSPYPYYNAASKNELDIPLLTVNRYGKGSVYFLNCGLMEDYSDTALPAQMEWGKKLLRKIMPEPSAFLEGGSGNVELVSYNDQKDGMTFVLLNHGGRENSFRILFGTDHITDPQPAYKVDLMIRSDADLQIQCGKEELSCMRKGKYISVPVVMDSTWKFIKVKEIRS